MKLLAILLSIYLVGLSLMPCEDSIATNDQTPEIHQVDGQDHSSSQPDDCTPFCQCHCCHVHITQAQQQELSLATTEISRKIPEKNYRLGDDLPRAFFQPPRV